jgi:hypothetical protein
MLSPLLDVANSKGSASNTAVSGHKRAVLLLSSLPILNGLNHIVIGTLDRLIAPIDTHDSHFPELPLHRALVSGAFALRAGRAALGRRRPCLAVDVSTHLLHGLR